MPLNVKQHKTLFDHFESSDTYIVDTMLDLIESRVDSPCVEILIGPHLIGADLSDPNYHEERLLKAYKLIGEETKSTFQKFYDYIKQVAWSSFVEYGGAIPEIFEYFYTTVDALSRWLQGIGEIPEQVRVRLFREYSNRIKTTVDEVYNWILSFVKGAAISGFGVIKSAADAAISLVYGLVKFAEKGYEVIAKAAGMIVSGLKRTLDVVAELAYVSVTYMSYSTMTLLENLTNQQDKESRKYAATVACFLLGCQEELLNYKKDMDVNVKKQRVASMAKEWFFITKKVEYLYKSKNIEPKTFLSRHWIKEKVYTWTSDVFHWIMKHMQWYYLSLQNYDRSNMIVVEAALKQAPMIWQVVFPKMILATRDAAGVETEEKYRDQKFEEPRYEEDEDDIDIEQEAQKLVQAALAFGKEMDKGNPEKDLYVFSEYLSENNAIDPKQRQDLKDTLKLRQNIQEAMEKQNEAARQVMYDPDNAAPFDNQWKIAEEMGKHLVGDPFDESVILEAYENMKGYGLHMELKAYRITRDANSLQVYAILRNLTKRDGKSLKDIESMLETKSFEPIGNDVVDIIRDLRNTDVIFSPEDIQKMNSQQILARLRAISENFQNDISVKQEAARNKSKNIVDLAKLEQTQIASTVRRVIENGAKESDVKFLEHYGNKTTIDTIEDRDIALLAIQAKKSFIQVEETATSELIKLQKDLRDFTQARRLEYANLETRLREYEENIKWGSKIVALSVWVGIYGYYASTVLANNSSFDSIVNASNTTGAGFGAKAAKQKLIQEAAEQALKDATKSTELTGVAYYAQYFIDMTFGSVKYLVGGTLDTVKYYALMYTPDILLETIDSLGEIALQAIRAIQILPLSFQAIAVPVVYLYAGGYMLMFGVATTFFGFLTLPALDFAQDITRIMVAQIINRFIYKDPRAQYTLTNMIKNKSGYLTRTLVGRSLPLVVQISRWLVTVWAWSVVLASRGVALPTGYIPFVGKYVATTITDKSMEWLDTTFASIERTKLLVTTRFDKIVGKYEDDIVDDVALYQDKFKSTITNDSVDEVLEDMKQHSLEFGNTFMKLLDDAQELDKPLALPGTVQEFDDYTPLELEDGSEE